MDVDTPRQKIVVGVDGSEHSKRALDWAADEAQLRQAVVAVVTAWHVPLVVHGIRSASGPPASLSLEDLVRQAAESVASSAERHAREAGASTAEASAREGHATDVLIAASEGAVLLVVGSQGHGSVHGFHTGTVSVECAQHAHCPTVVVR
jgi:nucleotide-binding universal stress UspA family protein